MTFKALVVEKLEDGTTKAAVQDMTEDRLPAGEVTVAVAYSTVNYKDGLCHWPRRWACAQLPACAGH